MVQGFVFGWNESAKRLYEKMRFEGKMRKREALWFNGRWLDLFESGMLEGE